MGLKEYRKKRDFSKTLEPDGEDASHGPAGKRRGAKSAAEQTAGEKQTAPEGQRIFVIHKHDASRLHYDLRLEMEGVLKSWAVPKGPSVNPADKHLAVQVEDHPLEYGSFEGIIPEGEYGGGTVMIWDFGVVEYEKGESAAIEAVRDQKAFKFTVTGSKLGGMWNLVPLKRSSEKARNWLLIKHRDAHAGEQDITRQTRSARTGRTMKQIADEGRQWHSKAEAEAEEK